VDVISSFNSIDLFKIKKANAGADVVEEV